MILIGREGSEGIPIGKLFPLVPTRLMIGVQLRKHRLVMVLKEGGRGERGGFFSDSQSKVDESDNWAANKAFCTLLLVEDLIGEGVLSQMVVIPIRIGGPKGRKRKVDGDLPPVVVHSTV
uniref:Translation initiation factor n=1 Tax=Solanum tuberosum TaxID=4113 RepID=M1DP54_SOLTU